MRQRVPLILLIILTHHLLIFIQAQNQQKAELYIETGHSNSVNSVSSSYDGKYLASIDEEGVVKIWDQKSLQELNTFVTQGSFNSLVEFSPSNKLIAVSEQTSLSLWDIETGKKIKELENVGILTQVAFSSDGSYLAFSTRDYCEDSGCGYYISTWNQKTDKVKTIFKAKKDFKYLTFDKGSKLLLVLDQQNIQTLDLLTSRRLETFQIPIDSYKSSESSAGTISPDAKTVAFSDDRNIYIYDLKSGQITQHPTLEGRVSNLSFSNDSRILAYSLTPFIGTTPEIYKEELRSSKTYGKIMLLDVEKKQVRGVIEGRSGNILTFDRNRKIIFTNSDYDKSVEIYDINSKLKLGEINSKTPSTKSLSFNPGGNLLAVGYSDGSIKIWDFQSGTLFKTLSRHFDEVGSISFSPNSDLIAVSYTGFDRLGDPGVIDIWNIEKNKLLTTLNANGCSVAFGQNNKMLIGKCNEGKVIYWDLSNFMVQAEFNANEINKINDLRKIAPKFFDSQETLPCELKETAKAVKKINLLGNKVVLTADIAPIEGSVWGNLNGDRFSLNKNMVVQVGINGKVRLYKKKSCQEIATLITINEKDWIVTTPKGQFDTNKSLDRIEGLHWLVNDEILKPLPLDIFMRQYYEPGLLQRILKCIEANNCDKEFKPLPSIAEINRVQPNVKIKEIKPIANSNDLANVTIEVENVTEEISLSATDKTQKKQLSSGAYDLRLFRDGQLVGVSTPKDKLEKFINDAPNLVAQTKASGKLINTPEDQAWREANDIFQIKAENVKRVSPTKIEYTFQNIKLPRDGRPEVAFTAYAFNADKVKSNTTEPVKFAVPQSLRNPPKKGRAVVVSIGVNASENPAYNLRYAANDARKMQEIVGERLKANREKYSEIVQIPLISDYDENKKLTENTAQKAIIKGVFSLLSGNEQEVPEKVLQQIPNREKIKPSEPEDTLLIAFSGHGYTDQSGIFYLLPYDIGEKTTKLTTEALQKTVSSDELSLWMQDITAQEMMMIIDACYSTQAVGEDFKPGPMGSRGLGQLAYDKDMKILSATQANNVALELNSLEQGLLSYALLKDGILNKQADTDHNKQLFSAEWLSFAEKRVPELYQEVRDGKRGIFKDGVLVQAKGTEVIDLGGKRKSNLTLQEPRLFDFKRRKVNEHMFDLLP